MTWAKPNVKNSLYMATGATFHIPVRAVYIIPHPPGIERKMLRLPSRRFSRARRPGSPEGCIEAPKRQEPWPLPFSAPHRPYTPYAPYTPSIRYTGYICGTRNLYNTYPTCNTCHTPGAGLFTGPLPPLFQNSAGASGRLPHGWLFLGGPLFFRACLKGSPVRWPNTGPARHRR